jgi:hypothetical protein
MRSKFDDNVSAQLVRLVTEGQTLTDACQSVGVSPRTGHNWASEGRRRPQSRFAGFASAVDAARTQARLNREEELEDYEPGPVERQVRALIAGRNLSPQESLLQRRRMRAASSGGYSATRCSPAQVGRTEAPSIDAAHQRERPGRSIRGAWRRRRHVQRTPPTILPKSVLAWPVRALLGVASMAR